LQKELCGRNINPNWTRMVLLKRVMPIWGDTTRWFKGEVMEKIFWDDAAPIGKDIRGGMFYRTMGLGRFIKECEDKGYTILGIRLTEENNGELMFIPPEE
jgi:hypothetical protein